MGSYDSLGRDGGGCCSGQGPALLLAPILLSASSCIHSDWRGMAERGVQGIVHEIG